MEMNGERNGAASLGAPALGRTGKWLSVTSEWRVLRWLLPLGMAVVSFGYHFWEYLGEYRTSEAPWDVWVEMALFTIVMPGIAWWLLKLTEAAEERESRARERVARIEEASRAVSSSLDLEEVLRQVCVLAEAQPEVKMAWVGLTEPGSSLVKLAAAAGGPTDYLQDVTITWDDAPAGRGPTGTAIRTGQPVVENDIAGSPSFAPWREAALSRGFLSSMALPLRTKAETVGALNLYSGQRGYFTPEVARGFAVFADQAAVAIANARLLEEVQTRRRHLEALASVRQRLLVELDPPIVAETALDAALDVLDADAAEVWEYDRDSEAMIMLAHRGLYPEAFTERLRFPLGQGYPGLVAQTAQPVSSNDLASDARFLRGGVLAEGINAYHCHPLLWSGQVVGALGVAWRSPRSLNASDLACFEMLSGLVGGFLENAHLVEELRARRDQLESLSGSLATHVAELEASQRRLQEAYMGILRTLNLAMEARDQYLRGHSDRDADYARRLALHLGLPGEEVRRVETAAQLHDIGKLVVPDSILLKPGPLEPAEWAVMRRHPTVAVEMLRFLDFLAPVLPLIEGDHERWDGDGYPHGLKGEEIPLGARILAVTDAYDAMTSTRPYRPAMSHQQACEILREGAGTQWDPRVVEAFFQVFRQGAAA